MIDLTPFVSTAAQAGRLGLQTPWRDGAWVYATNRHMIVRVPTNQAAADTPERDSAEHPNNVAAMFDSAFALVGGFFLFPPLPALQKCPECLGTGLDTAADPAGSATPWACPRCMSTGHAFDRFEICGVGYKLHYLHCMAQLPQARISTNGPHAAARVLFDGGQGLVMPLDPRP